MPTDNLDFSSAISGTLLDKDGQGTGFTSVQPNTADNAYDLGRIDLNTAASTLSAALPKQMETFRSSPGCGHCAEPYGLQHC